MLLCYELLTTFRIGRTGRRNNAGTAYTFFTEKNGKNAGPLIQILTEAKQVGYISLNVGNCFSTILSLFVFFFLIEVASEIFCFKFGF